MHLLSNDSLRPSDQKCQLSDTEPMSCESANIITVHTSTAFLCVRHTSSVAEFIYLDSNTVTQVTLTPKLSLLTRRICVEEVHCSTCNTAKH